VRRVAVVGSGIAGLAAARALDGHARVTLFEAGTRFGGHTHTVDVTLDGETHGVDTGFLVFNERTYPLLIQLFEELGIPTAVSDMSFSVKAPAAGGRAELEWSGSDLNGLFAQRANLLRPGFWRMLRDLERFNRICTGLAERNAEGELAQEIGDFLDQHRFSADFRDGYFLPMIACIWSCPAAQMLRFPIATMIRFCHNHGLIQIAGRPRWFTVAGGARQYVDKIVAGLPDVRLATPVRSVRRLPPGGGVVVATDAGSEHYDEVVLACHSDQALALLADPTEHERSVLGAIAYHPNRAVLHTDASLLPRRRRAWAAWNYERAADPQRERAGVCLHYLLNKLQPLPFKAPLIVSLNPLSAPRAGTVLGEFDYAHPVFDLAAIAAQRKLPRLQGRQRTWFCGAWTRYGFHEDGLASGLAVAAALKAQRASSERKAA
jgi:predicted NAD/FAD-binding protein